MRHFILALLLLFPSVCLAAPGGGTCADGRPYDPCIIYIGPVGAGECDGGYDGGDCDYQAYQTADTANDRNIAGEAYSVEFHFYDIQETGTFVVGGWTTSATYTLTFVGAESDRTATNTGIYSTERWRIEKAASSNGQPTINLQEEFITVKNLQVRLTDAVGYNQAGIGDNNNLQSTAVHLYEGNIIALAPSVGSYMTGFNYEESSTTPTITYINNIVYNESATYELDACFGHDGISGTWNMYNNTCYGRWTSYCIRSLPNTTATNNIFHQAGGSSPCFFQANGTLTYNMCNLSETDPGTNNLMNTSATYVSAGTFDFHLDTGSNGIDAGTDLSGSGVTDDIDSDTRSGTWDMGADETAGGGASRRIILTKLKGGL